MNPMRIRFRPVAPLLSADASAGVPRTIMEFQERFATEAACLD
jgi:hypothetical protein